MHESLKNFIIFFFYKKKKKTHMDILGILAGFKANPNGVSLSETFGKREYFSLRRLLVQYLYFKTAYNSMFFYKIILKYYFLMYFFVVKVEKEFIENISHWVSLSICFFFSFFFFFFSFFGWCLCCCPMFESKTNLYLNLTPIHSNSVNISRPKNCEKSTVSVLLLF
jgi:hypothetical protein